MGPPTRHMRVHVQFISVMARVNCHIVPFFSLHSFLLSLFFFSECILISSEKGNSSSDMIVLSDSQIHMKKIHTSMISMHASGVLQISGGLVLMKERNFHAKFVYSIVQCTSNHQLQLHVPVLFVRMYDPSNMVQTKKCELY